MLLLLLRMLLLAQQASCGAPPSIIPADANPLAGLPALPKPHFSWCVPKCHPHPMITVALCVCACAATVLMPMPCRYRNYFANGTGISDNRATLADYARITHSIPLCHGYVQQHLDGCSSPPRAHHHCTAAAPPAAVA